MGLVKTRRLAAMQKHPPALKLQRTWQRAKAGMKPPAKKVACVLPPHLYKSGGQPVPDGKCK